MEPTKENLKELIDIARITKKYDDIQNIISIMEEEYWNGDGSRMDGKYKDLWKMFFDFSKEIRYDRDRYEYIGTMDSGGDIDDYYHGTELFYYDKLYGDESSTYFITKDTKKFKCSEYAMEMLLKRRGRHFV